MDGSGSEVRMRQAELAEALGLPVRMVRYLVAERIIGPATERGRFAAGFGPGHLEDGRRYLALAASQPGGRVGPQLARALLGYPHGRAEADRAPREVDLGPFAVRADPEALAALGYAEGVIEDAMPRLRAWLSALVEEGRAAFESGSARDGPGGPGDDDRHERRPDAREET